MNIAAPGVRTAAQSGWRALLGAALAAPLVRTDLWLLGTLSFCLRGGALLLLMPIVVLPTQVEARLALGANLGSTGLTPGFWGLVGVATLASAVVTLGVLHALARIEARAFYALIGDPELLDEAGAGMVTPPLPARARPGLVSRLFVIEALAFVALLVLAIPLAATIGRTTVEELLRPTSAVTIYARVLAQVMPIAAVTAAVVPLIDTLAAFTVRELLLGRRLRDSPRAALGRLAGAPARSMGALLVGWLSLVLVVLAVAWALAVAWQAIRTAFLATTSLSELFERPDTLIVACLLAAVFVTGLALCGFVAAFRAALLTLARLRA